MRVRVRVCVCVCVCVCVFSKMQKQKNEQGVKFLYRFEQSANMEISLSLFQ